MLQARTDGEIHGIPHETRPAPPPVRLGVLSVFSPACTYWQVGTPNPAEFVSDKHPEVVRVTRTDGAKFELRSPTVRGDSLVGTAREDTLRAVGLALSDVQTIEIKRTSVGNTVGLVVVSAATVGFVAVIIECNNKEGFEKLDCP
jgi:hypothetical protein